MIRAGTMARTITARYHARCPACRAVVIPGDTVIYLPRRGVCCRPCGRAWQAKAVVADQAAADARAHAARTKPPND